MNETYIKIIIPNYNNITCIKQCLDSILNQTTEKFKIIIIDDLSTDMSDKICELYSRKYSDKIVFIQNKQHLGYNKTLQIGINYNLENVSEIKIIDCKNYLNNIQQLTLDSLNNFISNTKYKLSTKNKTSNLINVLIINFNNTLDYTKSLINDLLVQSDDYDLTIINNGSDNNAELYLKYLYNSWNFKNRNLKIYSLEKPIALNTLWNIFYDITENEWLCYLNNDICIPENFISDNIKIILREKNVGIINHATNKIECRTTNKLIYTKYIKNNNTLHRQGWDFTIKRELYCKIPDEFTTYVGDDIIFNNVYQNNKDIIFVYSSPILHYCSSSIQTNKQFYIDLMKKESTLYKSDKKYIQFGNQNNFIVDPLLSDVQPCDIDKLKQNIYSIDKQIIVTLTTWEKRINNIPQVLSSILNQTLKPDKIIINLSIEEFQNLECIPSTILTFIKNNNIEINFVEKNTKVHKKCIPTLLRYKNALIISIDDDFIYPENMIAEFYQTYKKFPNNPISGNKITLYDLSCHCGCASMIQYKFFGIYINNYFNYITNCPSDDILLTMLANENGYKYARTISTYFTNMQSLSINDKYSYSKNSVYSDSIICKTHDWLATNIYNIFK